MMASHAEAKNRRLDLLGLIQNYNQCFKYTPHSLDLANIFEVEEGTIKTDIRRLEDKQLLKRIDRFVKSEKKKVLALTQKGRRLLEKDLEEYIKNREV